MIIYAVVRSRLCVVADFENDVEVLEHREPIILVVGSLGLNVDSYDCIWPRVCNVYSYGR